ncbi:hypothetical protein T484DRAFT_3633132, partial [Baffinella frigidus]
MRGLVVNAPVVPLARGAALFVEGVDACRHLELFRVRSDKLEGCLRRELTQRRVGPGIWDLAPRLPFLLADPNLIPQFLSQQGVSPARLDRRPRGAVTRHAADPDHGTPSADPGCSEAQLRGRHAQGCECSRTDHGTGESERLDREH